MPQSNGNTATASGAGAVAIGRDATGNTIITNSKGVQVGDNSTQTNHF